MAPFSWLKVFAKKRHPQRLSRAGESRDSRTLRRAALSTMAAGGSKDSATSNSSGPSCEYVSPEMYWHLAARLKTAWLSYSSRNAVNLSETPVSDYSATDQNTHSK
jgi:hypothetical protein